MWDFIWTKHLINVTHFSPQHVTIRWFLYLFLGPGLCFASFVLDLLCCHAAGLLSDCVHLPRVSVVDISCLCFDPRLRQQSFFTFYDFMQCASCLIHLHVTAILYSVWEAYLPSKSASRSSLELDVLHLKGWSSVCIQHYSETLLQNNIPKACVKKTNAYCALKLSCYSYLLHGLFGYLIPIGQLWHSTVCMLFLYELHHQWKSSLNDWFV